MPLSVSVNGVDACLVTLWSMGIGDAWVWDRGIVDLDHGQQSISINVGGQLYLDHVNILYAGPNL